MNEENVFGKLRRIARNVQNESALAQERMSRPAALRASGDSARPVLQRMQRDAHNIKRESEEKLSNQPSLSDLSNILDSCSALCDAYRSKVNEIDSYLQQYGYQPHHSTKTKSTSSTKKAAVPRNKAAVSAEGKVTNTASSATRGDEEIKENIPATPPKKPDLASSAMKGGTPRLEDYGLSRGFLDMMSRNKLRGQEECRPGSVQEAAPLNSTYTKKDTIEAFTPLHSSSQASTCPFTPLGVTTTPAGVTVTPGLFGGNELPNETPTQFIDMVTGRPPANDRNASNPKKSLQFGSFYSKPAASSVLDAIPSHVTSENDGNFGTPPPPELTARWNFTSIHAPPPTAPDPTPQPDPGEASHPVITHLRFRPMAADTPPTPEMTMKWEPRSLPAMPVAPERLTSKIQHQLMEEPVRLTDQIPRHTPEEPQLILNNYGAPSHDETPETPLGLTGRLGRSKTFDMARLLTEEMPKTPELTMSYARYVQPDLTSALSGNDSVAAEVPPNPSFRHSQNPPPSHTMDCSVTTMRKAPVNVSFSSISEVTEPEFGSQNDYMCRILPLEFINQTVGRMNAVLQEKANKGAAVCLTDADIQSLELGAKSKAMLLFLIKLQRLTNTKTAGASEAGYYPVT